MQLFNLGKVPWQESQLIYHALAKLGREALCLVSPSAPYVCIGFHQEVAQEVDLDFCQANNIPVFRREVGGGAVYLDGNQLFFQLILQRDNPIAPRRMDAFYKKFLQPIIEVHHRIGIQAEYKPINDLVVETRKISGTGAGEIGDCIVFVGNLILDFDYATMSRVLKIPDEKFRNKVKKTIEENLSTIQRELGVSESGQWDERTLNHMMAQEFEKVIGPLTPNDKNAALDDKMQELQASMINDSWLFRKGKQVSGRVVKVRSGLEIMQRMHKATGGLIRAEFALEDGHFKEVSISGDFFCVPLAAVQNLESRLTGKPITEVKDVLDAFYDNETFEIPGITPDDWLNVLQV